MDAFKKMLLISKQRTKEQENGNINFQKMSKKKLADILKKKIQTGFIGAINSFEQHFGHLWGHGKKEVSQSEQMFKVIWDKCRNDILNNGNGQIRGAESELDRYNVQWNRYSYKFKKEGDTNEGIQN